MGYAGSNPALRTRENLTEKLTRYSGVKYSTVSQNARLNRATLTVYKNVHFRRLSAILFQ